MSDSVFPGQTTSDELKAMLRSMADTQAKQSDKMVEILVRQKAQDEKIANVGNMMAGLNQRLVAVEQKAERTEQKTERTARLQDELEGDVLREVGVQARKIDDLAAETTRQSRTLADQDKKLAELIDDKKQVLMLLKSLKWIGLAGPVVAGAVLWAMQHIKL